LEAQTRAIRAGTMRSQFTEQSEALLLTSSFVFDTRSRRAPVRRARKTATVYSRFSNPPCGCSKRAAALEGGQDAGRQLRHVRRS